MLCLSAGPLLASLALGQFTLAWTHSIEKIRWEEDWRIAGHQLLIEEARIRGSGAGMEIPADAILRHGVWHYRPPLPPQDALRLADSPHAGHYELCAAGSCRALAEWFPGRPALPEYGTLHLSACP